MTLNAVASWVLVIGYVVCALVTLLALGGLALGLSKLTAKLEELIERTEPLLAKADTLLTTTNEKVASIGDKAEGILAQGEETAENVHQKVDRTATTVQRTIHAPIIGLNSLAAGVSSGVQTFSRLQRGTAGGNLNRLPPTVTGEEVSGKSREEEQITREALTAPAGNGKEIGDGR